MAGGDFPNALALLAAPRRRVLLERLAESGMPVTRKELAADLGMGTNLLGFHLRKLVQAGLVEELPARRPGAGAPGRPAMTYRARHQEVESGPSPRRYDLIAEILLTAAPAAAGIEAAARDRGRRHAVRSAPHDATAAERLRDVVDNLARLGYSPRIVRGRVVPGDCPFYGLRGNGRAPLVCGINRCFVEGLLDGLGAAGDLVVEPGPAPCCTSVARTPAP